MPADPAGAAMRLRRAIPLLAGVTAPVGLLLGGSATAGGWVLAAGLGLLAATHFLPVQPSAAVAPDPNSAGISIWIEDWAEVGGALAALRRAGLDVEDQLATEPGLLHRLHHSIRITDVNDATLDLMGVTEKRLLLGRLVDVVPASEQTVRSWILAMACGDRLYRAESRIRRADGSQRDCLVTALLPRDPAGFSTIVVGVVDITDYKADQARLAQVERELTRAAHAATVGVVTASIAHEVKNPLAAVVTNADAALRWLRRTRPELAEAEAAIGAVVENALRARDVVDRTRLLLSHTSHEPEALDLAAAVRDAAQLLERELVATGTELVIKVNPGTPAVLADPSRLRQILTNLLANAVQAMEGVPCPRQVRVQAARKADLVCITVADSGTGIGPDQLERVFDPFFTSREGGIGVGLAICRACVEAHGGRIWASNAPGGGAVLQFTLPAAGHAAP